MRLRTMGLSLIALAGLALIGLPDSASAADKPAKAAAQPSPQAQPLAQGSRLAGIGFGSSNRPFLLADDGTFRDTMGRLAHEQNRSCGPLEAFGWVVPANDQRRVDGLTDSLSGALTKSKFTVQLIHSRVVTSPDIVIYTADQTEKHLLILWSLSPPTAKDKNAQLVLLICDSSVK